MGNSHHSSASKRSERTSSTGGSGESAAAVFVITSEDVRRSGATTLPELLRRVPGFDVAQIDGNKWAVSARGFNQRFGDKILHFARGCARPYRRDRQGLDGE